MKPRVLCLHSSADLYGSDRSLLRLVAGLDDFEFTVAVPYDGPLCDRLRACGAGVRVDDLPVVRRQCATPSGVARLAVAGVRHAAALRGFVRKNRIDLVYSNTTAVLCTSLGCLFAGLPHVQHVRETIVRPRAVRFLLACGGLFSSCCVCVSEATRRNYVSSLPGLRGRSRVVHNGIDVDAYRQGNAASLRGELGLASGDLLVGTIGRISEVKGLDVFVAAAEICLREARESGSRLVFAIVGDAFQGKDRLVAALRRRIESGGGGGDIRLLGFRNDIADVLAGLDVYIHTSVLPDSFPTTVLEALAAGLPVVATRLGGVAEMIEEEGSGLFVEPGDADAMARACMRLLRKPDLRAKLGAAGRDVCGRRFTADRYVTSMRDVFLQAMAARGGRSRA
jgi:glycosyltransferase involved in cell wall biosynthesis